jgi:glutamate--cysteine ligase
MDPTRLPERLNSAPRYGAMEEYFRRRETGSPPWGPDMMCNTAAVQVNVGLGDGTAESRWRIAHDLGPVLVAAFASSPFRHGTASGWKSTRQVIWWNLDTCRTRPPERGADLAETWVRFALDAQVMFVRAHGGTCLPVTHDMTMRAWLEGAYDRAPDDDDLVAHLSTLFPPVRPRGWLEMRMIDMPPDDWWVVPLLLVDTLVRNDSLADRVAEICRPVRGAWLEAACHGLELAGMAEAAGACFELATEAAGEPNVAAAIRDYADNFVLRGRTPADEMLGTTLRSVAT